MRPHVLALAGAGVVVAVAGAADWDSEAYRQVIDRLLARESPGSK